MSDDHLLSLIRRFNDGVDAQRDRSVAMLEQASNTECPACGRTIGTLKPDTACDHCSDTVRAMYRLAASIEDLVHIPEWIAT